jgi:hypothetical protein
MIITEVCHPCPRNDNPQHFSNFFPICLHAFSGKPQNQPEEHSSVVQYAMETKFSVAA